MPSSKHRSDRRPGQRIDTDSDELAERATDPARATSKSKAELLQILPVRVLLDRVVNERVAAEFLSLSLSYFRMLRDEGRGPAWIRLSDRRIGYRVRDLMDWCEARKRPGGIRGRLNPVIGMPITGDER